jgi:hypothetical protein
MVVTAASCISAGACGSGCSANAWSSPIRRAEAHGAAASNNAELFFLSSTAFDNFVDCSRRVVEGLCSFLPVVVLILLNY